MQTYYDNLKVPRTASLEEIKKAYKRLIFIHHPDRHPPELKDEKTRLCPLIAFLLKNHLICQCCEGKKHQ